MALAQFDGTLILVSHDRHLLRSTADEFLLVADGKVEPFNGDLDDYRQWLEQRTRAARSQSNTGTGSPRTARTAITDAAPPLAPTVQGLAKGSPSQDRQASPAPPPPRAAGRQKGGGGPTQRKPLERDIVRLEQEIERLSAERIALDTQLADPELYLPARQPELAKKQARHAEIAARLESAEADWLASQEALAQLG